MHDSNFVKWNGNLLNHFVVTEWFHGKSCVKLMVCFVSLRNVPLIPIDKRHIVLLQC